MQKSPRVVKSFWFLWAALLVAALCCAAVLWLSPAREADAQAAPDKKVLVFSKTAGFRHDSIPAGIAAIQKLGAENGFGVDATEDGARFTDQNLAQYDAVVFMSTTGDVLNDQQQAAFERFVGAGGGYTGIHAAADTEYNWGWYGQLVGGYFKSHPAGTPQATVKVEDANNPSTSHLPANWVRNDEWYNYQTPVNPVVNGNQPGIPDYSPRQSGVHVLATVDESTYDEQDDSAAADDHPIAWCSTFTGGGRSFYTGGGHTQASFTDENFTKHLLGGIRYVSGTVEANCGEARTLPESNYPPPDQDFEQVTLAKGVPNVGEPMSLSVLPDGRVLHNARDGRVFLTTPAGATSVAATVPVYQHDEDGLQSLTVDPNFEQNGWVYLYYAPPLNTPAGDAPNEGTAADFERFEGHNRLSRVKLVGNSLDMSTEQELLRVEADRGICCHAGGAIDFDAEGNLYLSTGDDSNPFASDGYAPIDERPNRNPAYDAQRSSANTNDLRGKVIRIKPDPTTADYSIPAGNLFDEAADTGGRTRPEIYAMGFRNPFRMTVDDETGYVYLGEYGPDAGGANANRGPAGIVEFNQIREAGNYGWPYCTGPNTTANTYNDYNFATGQSGAKFDCQNPVNESPNNTGLTNLPAAKAAWIHYDGGNVTYNGKTTNEFGGGGEGPMAGPVYNFDPDLQSDFKFPEYYDNHFFAGEWTRGWIKDIALDANGNVAGINSFFDSMTLYAAMDMEFGPDGSLYVLDYGNGGYFTGNENSAVYKINYVAGDRSPIAQADADPTSGRSPLTVQFSSEGSRDPDGTPITYAWDFQDDGTIDSTEANPSFTYEQNGDYTARLTVTDESGKTGNATTSITVGNTRPTVKIEVPPDGGFFEFGDDVPYRVTVTDPEDGSNIDCSKVQITYVLGHDSHGHPLSDATGCEGTLRTVRDEGHGDSANVFGVINARYTDTGGEGAGALAGEDEVILQPKRKQAEFYNSMGRAPNTGTDGDPGVQKETSGDSQGGGQNIGYVEDGDYVSFEPMNLLNISSLTFRVASGGDGGTIQVRLDSPDGPLVAETEFITPTGGWQTYKNVDLQIPETGGTHELFFVFRNPGSTALMNMNWIDFNGRGVSTNARPRVEATATPSQGEAPLDVAFDGTATDADGEDLTYEWDFEGDGTVDARTLDATHTYSEPGSYTARLTATDPKGASDSATVRVLVRAACDIGRSDEFEGDALDRQRWSVIQGDDTYSVSDGQLNLPIGRGSIYGPGGSADNIIVQDTPSGQWTATTKVTAEPNENYQQAGLRLYSDNDNWASVHLISANGQRDIEFIYENAGNARNNAEDKIGGVPADFPSTYYVRLASDGTDLRAFYSADGETFEPVGRPAPMSSFATPKIGPTALSGGAASVPMARFDWVRIDPDAGGAADATPSDEFDGASLDKCRWNAIVREDPSKYKLENGALSVTTTDGDIYQGDNVGSRSNFILQSPDRAPASDYVLETRLSGTITDGYAQGGLIVYGDDGNYVKLDAIADQGAGRINRIEFRSEVNEAIQNPQPEIAAPANVSNYRLRLTKTGDSYTGEVAFDGGDWQTIGTVSNPTPDMSFGLFTVGVQQPDRVVNFDYFRATGANQPPANEPPVADDESATTNGGEPVDVDVLQGDTDPDGDTLTLGNVTDPANGTATKNADDTIKYTPDAGFVGVDTFSYTISDGNGGTDTGTVTVTVNDPQCGPLTTPDDPFDGTSLDKCRWNAVVAEDPTKYSVADGGLNLTTTRGEIYQGNTDKSNLIMQSASHANEDYVLETKIDVSGLDGGYSQGGIMAYGSDANYVKIAPIADDWTGFQRVNRIELRSEVNDTVANGPDIEVTAEQAENPIWLRLTKTGTTYKGEVSFDGQTWQEMASTVSNPMSSPRFGVYAAGVLQEGDTVSFDYFTVDGEDAPPDTAAPTIRDLDPRDGSSTRDRTPRIGATVRDRVDDLTGDNIELSVDGRRITDFSFNREDRLGYVPERKMGYGRHTVRVVATDAAGNRAAEAWSFKVVKGG